MNQTERALLEAVQKTIWKTETVFEPDTDWNAVLEEAEKQTVLGIVAPVAPNKVQREWLGRTSAVTANFVRILHYQDALCTLLRENGIPFVILKGTAAAIYYPDPSKRSMGDIDYLVPAEQFDRATDLLRAAGYQVDDDPRTPRHIHVYRDGISFEQHRFFSSEGVDIERYITDGLGQTVVGEVSGITFPMLPKLANGLVLLGHMVQHLKSGLGLRQVIDWMLFVDRALDDAFWADAFEKAARETGLDTAAVTATKMCQMYLGLSQEFHWCAGADAALCKELMESLLSSGNFDRKRGKGSSFESVSSNISRRGLFRYLQTAGEFNWKYHKHKWLKPFAWIYQIGRYARQGLKAKRSGAQIREDIERGRQRTRILEKLNIK